MGGDVGLVVLDTAAARLDAVDAGAVVRGLGASSGGCGSRGGGDVDVESVRTGLLARDDNGLRARCGVRHRRVASGSRGSALGGGGGRSTGAGVSRKRDGRDGGRERGARASESEGAACVPGRLGKLGMVVYFGMWENDRAQRGR